MAVDDANHFTIYMVEPKITIRRVVRPELSEEMESLTQIGM